MKRTRTRWLKVAIPLFFACVSGHAQTVQFVPEIDTYVKLNSTVRVYFEAKDDRDGGAPHQAGFGPSIQLYLKPLIKLKHVTAFDLDDSKPRSLVLETGYRYVVAPNTPAVNRMQAVATLHFPMKAAVVITDRNRADLDWKSGYFSWRYRNKLTLERTFTIHAYHLIPYASVEPYYESRYGKWSTTALYIGCLFPVGKHVEFNSYYEHENNTGRSSNQQVNATGLALYLYFSVERK